MILYHDVLQVTARNESLVLESQDDAMVLAPGFCVQTVQPHGTMNEQQKIEGDY
jgi:hypothetical protein